MSEPVESAVLPPRPITPARLRQLLWALVFASAACGLLLLVRWMVAQQLHFSGLFGNLLLAWIPAALALYAHHLHLRSLFQRWRLWLIGGAWLLFFPNCFYIVTDLVHMRKHKLDGVPYWYDLLLIAAFAFAGVFLGCLSLYLMHLLIRERFGFRWGWAFAIGAQALGAVGIFMGRFLRLNSWDVSRPARFWEKTVEKLEHAPPVWAFSATMFLFSLMAYWFVVAIARLHEDEV